MNLFVWITGGSILGAALIALCNYALKNYIKNITKNHFDKNIENHKQELTKELKEVEVNYQRKMEDFSLYTQKRHGVYANLYKHLNEAVNKMLYATSSLRQYPLPQAPQPDFEDVKKILLDEDFDNEDINKVIRKWWGNSLEGSKEASRLFDSKRIIEANKDRIKAHTFFLESELYLNDNIAEIISDTLKVLHKMFLDEMAIIRYPDTDIENERRDNHEKNNQKVSTQIDQIKIQMRKELSIGDYA